MPKAILIIDVPTLNDGRHLCNECPIWNKEHLFCQYDLNMKAKGCPLRLLPQKKGKYGELHQYDTDIHYEIGWNECLEEITGETE